MLMLAAERMNASPRACTLCEQGHTQLQELRRGIAPAGAAECRMRQQPVQPPREKHLSGALDSDSTSLEGAEMGPRSEWSWRALKRSEPQPEGFVGP